MYQNNKKKPVQNFVRYKSNDTSIKSHSITANKYSVKFNDKRLDNYDTTLKNPDFKNDFDLLKKQANEIKDLKTKIELLKQGNNAEAEQLKITLEDYANYIREIETDSIEISDTDNCLDKKNYWISDELQDSLMNGYKYKGNRTITKKSKSIYLVVFRNIKRNGENILIYHYIKYPFIFASCLLNYLSFRDNNTIISPVYKDYLIVISHSLLAMCLKEINQTNIEDFIEEYNQKAIDKIDFRNDKGIYPKNIIDIYKVIFREIPIIREIENMSNLIDLSINKDFSKLINEIFDPYINNTQNYEYIYKIMKQDTKGDFNLLNRCVFILEDLYYLVDCLNKYIYKGEKKVSQGSQSWRGQINSMSNTLIIIDKDFRDSLYRHNQYHFEKGNIGNDKLLFRNKFSYKNIHMNLGYVRW